jgi:hypothetical protein
MQYSEGEEIPEGDMLTLKKISKSYVPSALLLAEKYRMLNHPRTAESICRDCLEADSENQETITLLILSIIQQFSDPVKYADIRLRHAEEWIDKLQSEYQKEYLSGLTLESWAKARVREISGSDSFEFFKEAMQFYEKAILIRPENDESALLHYNLCVRYIDNHPHVGPSDYNKPDQHYGDSFHH